MHDANIIEIWKPQTIQTMSQRHLNEGLENKNAAVLENMITSLQIIRQEMNTWLERCNCTKREEIFLCAIIKILDHRIPQIDRLKKNATQKIELPVYAKIISTDKLTPLEFEAQNFIKCAGERDFALKFLNDNNGNHYLSIIADDDNS